MTRSFSSSLAPMLLAALVLATAACGDDPVDDSNDPVTPPENPERKLPTAGAPDDDEWEAPPPAPDYEHEDRVDTGGGECCPVTFAFAPDNPDEVQEATLRGSLYPLDSAEGLPLTQTDGVWSGEACLAPDQYATYHYELGLAGTGGGELFLSVAHNPYAPTATVAGEVVNAWIPGDDCASIDVAVHAKTAE